jgi:hypothetical protein
LVALWCAIGVAEAAIAFAHDKKPTPPSDPLEHAVVRPRTATATRPSLTRTPRRA